MTDYIEVKPTSQDDLLDRVRNIFSEYGFSGLRLLTLFNSGMGSGKSNIMTRLPLILKEFSGIVLVLEKNLHLQIQIMNVFMKSNSITKMKMMRINPDKHEIVDSIRLALSIDKIPVVFLKNVAHSSGSLNKSAKLLESILRSFPAVNKLALIDELDSQLTSLSGGINAKLDHPAGIMKEYAAVVEQKTSLNIFDILQNYSVKTFGFSGTMNNLICSKLPSLGYKAKDILTVNVYPIATLYGNLKVIPTDVNDFGAIAPYLEEAETKDHEKTLIIVPKVRRISEFKRYYHKYFGRSISSVQIIGENENERMTPEWKEAFKNAKYIFGVNIVTTGFDLSTWVEGQEFTLGILYRKLSDKISQPLSKNQEHALHMDTAASLMQLLARLRKGGKFLVPSQLDGRPLYDRLVEVSDRIKDGLNEYNWVGGIPGVTQAERHHQSLVIALVQNLKLENRPIVEGILTGLKSLTGRDFEEEMKMNLETPSSFDHVFWTSWIGCLWKTYHVDHETNLSDEEKSVKKAEIVDNHRRGIVSTSGGLRNERVIDERIKDQICQRSENTCGHCGENFEETDVPQDCHIKRHDDNGGYAMNNIIRGHTSCDSMYDSEGLMIYDTKGEGVWLRRKCAKSNSPHRKQLGGVSIANFTARWNWEKDRQGQSDISDDKFIEYLRERGYIYKRY